MDIEMSHCQQESKACKKSEACEGEKEFFRWSQYVNMFKLVAKLFKDVFILFRHFASFTKFEGATSNRASLLCFRNLRTTRSSAILNVTNQI